MQQSKIKPIYENQISGIYVIFNVVTGKFYLGSSKKIWNRWKEHKRELKKKSHFNSHLQNAWNKYGEYSFCFIAIEEVPKEDLLTREQYYLDMLKSFETCIGYNLNSTAKSGSFIRSSEWRELVSKRMKGKQYSKGHKVSKEIAVKRAEWCRGKPLSEEHKNKIKEAHTKRKYLINYSGENNPNSKLTVEQTKLIREERLKGRLLKDLSREFGISISAVSFITTNRSWKNAT